MSLIKFINNSSGESLIMDESVRRTLGSLTESTIASSDLPIQSLSSDWSLLSNPERLSKVFYFEDFETLKYFIDELLLYQERNYHHSSIKIDNREVLIETYTHDLERVTSQDKNLSDFCDEVFQDIRFIRRSNET
jgi:pterin-4a-carbinolamine dehydratase